MVESKNNKIKYVVLIVVIAILAVLILNNRELIHHISIRHIREFILKYGKFSAMIFVIIYSLKPILLVIPASWMTIAAGSIFGPFAAFTLSMIGCFFGGTLAFYLSRILGKPFVDKMLKGKAMELDDRIEKEGFIIVLLMRLSIIFPFDALSYAAGLTKVKYKDFIVGTMLGVIPEMISYSFIGKRLGRPFSRGLIVSILATIIIAVIAAYIYKKRKV